MRIRINRIKFTSILIAILPILGTYRFGSTPLSWADVALSLIVLVSLSTWLKHKMSVNGCWFLAYFLMMFLVSCLQIIAFRRQLTSDFVQKWLKIFVYYYVIDIVSGGSVDADIFRRWSMWCGFAASVILILQAILFSFFGYQLFPYIRFLNFYYTRDIPTPDALIRTLSRVNLIRGYCRYCSIFCEPAHFAQYTLLSLVIAIFDGDGFSKDKRRVLCAACITAAIFLSTSANGIFLTVLIWGLYVFIRLRGRMSARFLGAAVLLVVGGVIFLVSTDFWGAAVDRVRTVSSSGGSTGTLRLLQGFSIFTKLSPAEKLIGLGFGNVQTYMIEKNITTAYLSVVGNEAMNSFSTVLVSGGVVGFILYFIIWCRQFFVYKRTACRCVLVVISILFCTSGLFYLSTSVMYLSAIRALAYDREKELYMGDDIKAIGKGHFSKEG